MPPRQERTGLCPGGGEACPPLSTPFSSPGPVPGGRSREARAPPRHTSPAPASLAGPAQRARDTTSLPSPSAPAKGPLPTPGGRSRGRGRGGGEHGGRLLALSQGPQPASPPCLQMSLPRGRHGHRVSPGSPPLTHPEGRAPRLRAWPWGVTTRLSAPHHRSHWPRGDGDDRSGPSPWRSGDSPSTRSSPEGLSGGFPVPGPGVAPSLGPGRSGRRQSGCGRRRRCQTRGQSCSPPPEPSHPNSRGAHMAACTTLI